MKKKPIIILFALFCVYACFQTQVQGQAASISEQQLENLTAEQEIETEDDSYGQTLIQYRRNPLNLNSVEENELRELRTLSELQIQSLLSYRRFLGNFISIYELQAVPLFDIETIQQLVPYVKVVDAVPVLSDINQRLTRGEHSVLFRLRHALETKMSNHYIGSPQHLFFRHKYAYRNLLQFGLTGDKDAGEQFFKGKQRYGFDFYSLHLFARKLGKVKSLAIGDFTVNLGQGLIHWQSLAFKKSADITSVKRQSDILKPYNSAGEYNFMRGFGTTIGGERFSVTAFASIRNLDGSFHDDTTDNNRDFVTSILSTGYHRTVGELAKKNTLTQTALGGNVRFRQNKFIVGVNGIAFKFSVPIVRNQQPYNRFSFGGAHWYNYSVDYSYTFRNFHFFGEAAMDKEDSKAFINGIITSLDPKIDASVVYRNIEKGYQALYGNAFTEGSYPSNEKGLFTGISIKPSAFFKIDAYTDVFIFPWLRYRIDAPTRGSEYLLQIIYKPNKQIEIYTRFRHENKGVNVPGIEMPLSQVYIRARRNWRLNSSYVANRKFTLRQRVELVWEDGGLQDQTQPGLLMYVDGKYKPSRAPFSLMGRIQYFQTDSSASRLYSFENDVLYSYSIPQYAGKGLRYYINGSCDISNKVSIWLRWAQTIPTYKTLDRSVMRNKRTEVKFQVMYNF